MAITTDAEGRMIDSNWRTLKVTAGPSKFDLMLSLFENKEVTFTIEGLGELKVVLESVWVFGPTQGNNYQYWMKFHRQTEPRLHWALEGHDVHFDTRTRTGFCSLTHFTEEQAAQFDREIAPKLAK